MTNSKQENKMPLTPFIRLEGMFFLQKHLCTKVFIAELSEQFWNQEKSYVWYLQPQIQARSLSEYKKEFTLYCIFIFYIGLIYKLGDSWRFLG